MDEIPRPLRRWPAVLAAALLALAACPAVLAAWGSGTRVLVLGVDRRPGDVGRADTLLVVSPRPLGPGLVLLSIPRDTRVDIPGHGPGKINAAYALGGPVLARRAAEGLLGVRLHRVAVLDFAAVRAVVDALGCVTVDVDRTMRYRDPYQDLEIRLDPGRRCLDGEQALGYVRFRGDPEGDIARVARQRAFLRALVRQALSPRSWPRLPAAWSALRAHLEGDLTAADLLRLGAAGAAALVRGTAEATVPGRSRRIGGLSYWVADPAALAAEVERLLGRP